MPPSINFILSGDDLLISNKKNKIKLKIDDFEYLVLANEKNFSHGYEYSIGQNDYLIKTKNGYYAVKYEDLEKIVSPKVTLELEFFNNPPIVNESYFNGFDFSIVKRNENLYISNCQFGKIYENVNRIVLKKDEYNNQVYKMLNDTTYDYKRDTTRSMPIFESGVYSVKKNKWIISPNKFQLVTYNGYSIFNEVDTNKLIKGEMKYPTKYSIIDQNGKILEENITHDKFMTHSDYKKYRLKNDYSEGLKIIFNQPDYYDKNKDDLLLLSSQRGFSLIDYDNKEKTARNKDFIFYYSDYTFEIHNDQHKFGGILLNENIDVSKPYEITTVDGEIKIIQAGDSIKSQIEFYEKEFKILVNKGKIAYYSYDAPKVDKRNVISSYDKWGDPTYKEDENGYYVKEKYVIPFKTTCGLYDLNKKRWDVEPGIYDVIDRTDSGLKFSKLNSDLTIDDDMKEVRKNYVETKSIGW